MRVDFDENGTLIIHAENNTDKVALSSWWEKFNSEDPTVQKPAFGVDVDSYREVIGVAKREIK